MLAGCGKVDLGSVKSKLPSFSVPKISLPKFSSGKKKKAGLDELFEKAGNNDPVAQAQLGDKYLFCIETNGDLNKAFMWYTLSAQAENPYAQYMLGFCYQNGLGTEKNDARAMEFYEKAAEAGSLEAQYVLGKIYSAGPEEDKFKALKWKSKLFTTCSTSEDEHKDFYLGDCYFGGKGTAQDVKAGLKIMESAGKRGYGLAYIILAETYLNGDGVPKNDKKAKSYAEKGAKLMGGYGKYRLAQIQEAIEKEEQRKSEAEEEETYATQSTYSSPSSSSGNGILGMLKQKVLGRKSLPTPPKKVKKAKKPKKQEFVKNLEKAAELDFAPAQYVLGQRERRNGNTKEAFDWFTKAARNGYPLASRELEGKSYEEYLTDLANHGDVEAQYNLGKLFLNYKSDSKKLSDGFEMIKLAEESGFKEARRELANCYFNGIGTPPNPKKAINLYRLEAEDGNTEAQYILGHAYWNGLYDLPKSQEESFKYYMKAAEKNHSMAQAAAGICLLYGYGTPKDEAEGFAWLKKGSVSGDGQALYILGQCYENGTGTEKDPVKAFDAYHRASSTSKEALYKLGKFYKEGTAGKKDIKKALECFGKLADNNNDVAAEIADIYYFGDKDFKPDYDQAAKWYASASKASAYAKYRLGECYHYGRGKKQSFRRATTCYKEAFDEASKHEREGNAGVSDSYCLGMCYEYGKAVPKDLKKAIYYYEFAERANFCDASKKVQELKAQ